MVQNGHDVQIGTGGEILNQYSSRAVVLWAIVATVVAIALGGGAANAQIIPTTSSTDSVAPPPTPSTTAPEETTTTTVVEETTTTETTAPAPTTTGAPRSTTTTAPRATSSTFVPPAGVSPTTAMTTPAAGSLDADTGRLPLFVSLSLGGFAVAIAILTVQWVRSRPTALRR